MSQTKFHIMKMLVTASFLELGPKAPRLSLHLLLMGKEINGEHIWEPAFLRKCSACKIIIPFYGKL